LTSLPPNTPLALTGRPEFPLRKDWTRWRVKADVEFVHVFQHIVANAMPCFFG
jgi:hypothetical protein